jgi:hypothetical protein
LIYYQLVEEGAARSNPEVLVKQRRGRQNIRNSQQNINDDLSGMTSVVVTTSDVQHHDLNDENVVAVSGIPGNKYTVKPDLTTTCEQRPPVNNGQFESSTASQNLSFIRHLCLTAVFSGPRGGRCTQV